MATLPDNANEMFWSKDGNLWSHGRYGKEVTDYMGWIDVALTMQGRVNEINDFVERVRKEGFDRVILAGMGGSSLATYVLDQCLSSKEGLPLLVLDSTDPATILRIEKDGPIGKALVIISTKSGSTAEPNAFCDYLLAKIDKVKGASTGGNFVAITDPGSPFESRASELEFQKIFLNFPDIGGRYSALSYFGLVPAALMGIDLNKLLEPAVQIMDANGPGRKTDQCPAFELGIELGEHCLAGRNKLTFILPESLKSVGLWMEQLVAESTGKEGKGILPVAGEEIAPASHYGHDRVFAYIREGHDKNHLLDTQISALRDAGQPVIDCILNDRYDIGGEFMKWEIATAIAGAVIGINPFDQPNVQESKDITKRYVQMLEDKGSLPPETANCKDDSIEIFGGSGNTLEANFENFFGKVKPGDYICLQAYLTESPKLDGALSKLQAHLRDKFKVACTCGFGPRFLHSTGQFHKGGPNTGHFVQLTQSDEVDVKVPKTKYTFGAFRNAQARGDKDALLTHNRRVIRFELGSDVMGGVDKLDHLAKSK